MKMKYSWKDQVSFPLRKSSVFSTSGSRADLQMVPVLSDAELDFRETVRKIQSSTDHFKKNVTSICYSFLTAHLGFKPKLDPLKLVS